MNTFKKDTSTACVRKQMRSNPKASTLLYSSTDSESPDSSESENSSDSDEDVLAKQKRLTSDAVRKYQNTCDEQAKKELAAAQIAGRLAQMPAGASQSYLIAAFRHNQTVNNKQ